MNNTLFLTSTIISGSIIFGIISRKMYDSFVNQILFDRYILEKHITNKNTKKYSQQELNNIERKELNNIERKELNNIEKYLIHINIITLSFIIAITITYFFYLISDIFIF